MSAYFSVTKRPVFALRQSGVDFVFDILIRIKFCGNITILHTANDVPKHNKRRIKMNKAKELLSQAYNQLDEYNKGGTTQHNLLWKAMGNIEDALKELEGKQ